MSNQNIKLKDDAIDIINAKLAMNEVRGDLAGWHFSVENDFLGQASRAMQSLCSKLARTIDAALVYPRSKRDPQSKNDKEKNKLSYTGGALDYLIITVLGYRIRPQKYEVLVPRDDKNPQFTNNMNREANTSKHDLKKDRSAVRAYAKVYNEMINELAQCLHVDAVKGFAVDVSCIKRDNEISYNAKYKTNNQPAERRWQKSLRSADDVYIQMHALHYQRDFILEKAQNAKWDEIRRNHRDHHNEMCEIDDGIGLYTHKINCLITALCNGPKNNRAVAEANSYIRYEIKRNDKIIAYTQDEINRVDAGEGELISSRGYTHSNTTNLKNYVQHKEAQNQKLYDMQQAISMGA